MAVLFFIFVLFYFMNKPRDLKGRYVKTNPKLPTKVPTILFGGRHTTSINFVERYQKVKVGDNSN
jgi:hypothetical protein